MNSVVQQPNPYRQAVRHLASGVVSPAAARMISVGTESIELQIMHREYQWESTDLNPNATLIAGDWGVGKTHLSMLLIDSMMQRGIPFIHDYVDGRSGSLAHMHRTVPRWLEALQIGYNVGIRNAVEVVINDTDNVLTWCRARRHRHFPYGLYHAASGDEWFWNYVAGHQFQYPDYSYNHYKALAMLSDAGALLRAFNKRGIVLFLDEAENISRQYDIRGRRKSYDTLWRLMNTPELFLLIFVTDRFFEQVTADKYKGQSDRWRNWSVEAIRFITRIESVPIAYPPVMDVSMAGHVVKKVIDVYQRAHHCTIAETVSSAIISAWRQTATKSVRLLVRLTVDTLDRSIENVRLTPEPFLTVSSVV